MEYNNMNKIGDFFENQQNYKAFYCEKMQVAGSDLSELKHIGSRIEKDERLSEEVQMFLIDRINDIVEAIINRQN